MNESKSSAVTFSVPTVSTVLDVEAAGFACEALAGDGFVLAGFGLTADGAAGFGFGAAGAAVCAKTGKTSAPSAKGNNTFIIPLLSH
jgi:hypothetical protein